ncbi:trigger factor [Chlorobaculum sp. MV4-Y]|uniref:trigger factor n=1 Tax=Chlorobaculum sp. MV4-Y TaxID=2976335 RepID=UPI0021AE5E83|nr:trigger factor [Chlorobaculum sp. MV4-Y]UWX57334.1 trigger factor [Chlorobaculum sp. MV4-Y]
MQKNITNVSEIAQELEIILTAEEYQPEYDQQLEEARKSVRIKGFRQGHVPAGMLKRIIGPSIEAEVAEKMASKHFAAIAEEEKINPASRAQIESYNYEDGKLTIKISYEIHPEFELKDFSDYTFTQAEYTVSDEDVDREIKLILRGHGTMVTSEEAAAEGDTVIGDVTKLDAEGAPIEGSKNENHHFNLEYLPADNPFRMALEGKKAGDVADVTIEPKEEGSEANRFRIEIKEVKHLELPELDDELVKEISQQRFEKVEDFRNDVRLQLQAHFSDKSEHDLLEAISSKLIEEHPVPTPSAMVAQFQNMLLENAKRQVGGQFPKGLDEREFFNTMKPNAEKHARWLLVSQKIAKENNLEVTDEDIKAFAEKEAEKEPSLTVDQRLNTYMSSEFKDYIIDTILKEKIYDVIKSKVTITKEATPVPVHN